MATEPIRDHGLFTTRKDLVNCTSALCYPVFVNGKNFTGRTKKMLKESLLRETIEQYLGDEFRLIHCISPLGDAVADVLFFMVETGIIQRNQILAGMSHPSGVNAERIVFFLGEKAQEDLSEKTNPAPTSLINVCPNSIPCLKDDN